MLMERTGAIYNGLTFLDFVTEVSPTFDFTSNIKASKFMLFLGVGFPHLDQYHKCCQNYLENSFIYHVQSYGRGEGEWNPEGE